MEVPLRCHCPTAARFLAAAHHLPAHLLWAVLVLDSLLRNGRPPPPPAPQPPPLHRKVGAPDRGALRWEPLRREENPEDPRAHQHTQGRHLRRALVRRTAGSRRARVGSGTALPTTQFRAKAVNSTSKLAPEVGVCALAVFDGRPRSTKICPHCSRLALEFRAHSVVSPPRSLRACACAIRRPGQLV